MRLPRDSSALFHGALLEIKKQDAEIRRLHVENATLRLQLSDVEPRCSCCERPDAWGVFDPCDGCLDAQEEVR